MANFMFLCTVGKLCSKSNNESSHKGERKIKLLLPIGLEIISLLGYKQLFTALPSLQGKEALLNLCVEQILNCHTSRASLPDPNRGSIQNVFDDDVAGPL